MCSLISAHGVAQRVATYGLFRMDYVGKKNGAPVSTVSSILKPARSASTRPDRTQTTRMALSASSTNSGAGTIATNGGASFDFAYDAHYFRRTTAATTVLDRAKPMRKNPYAVWTYNANDGSRVDLAHPGFPIVATYSGNSYYGFANYWGINFRTRPQRYRGCSANLRIDLVDQRPATPPAIGSRKWAQADKWTQQATTLDSLNNIPISIGGD